MKTITELSELNKQELKRYFYSSVVEAMRSACTIKDKLTYENIDFETMYNTLDDEYDCYDNNDNFLGKGLDLNSQWVLITEDNIEEIRSIFESTRDKAFADEI